ncbi:Histone-lysine N-methyltransferase 2D [Xenoophorus captivus]|uniref:Histone-lysine N-methyltransferase 2D n=1 Tax=Xenoophorus captivus TaxID=1517983 RepID=A0ABV0QEG0_9TELE
MGAPGQRPGTCIVQPVLLKPAGGKIVTPEDGGEESPWATPSTPVTPSSPPTPTEAEGDGLSYNQRSLQRWEKDEGLGELSTISPVLYANTNFPSLKQDYPG